MNAQTAINNFKMPHVQCTSEIHSFTMIIVNYQLPIENGHVMTPHNMPVHYTLIMVRYQQKTVFFIYSRIYYLY